MLYIHVWMPPCARRTSMKKIYFVFGTFSTAPYAFDEFFLFCKFLDERKYYQVNGNIFFIWMPPCARARTSLKKKYFVFGTFSTAPYAITDFFLFSKFLGERKYSWMNGDIILWTEKYFVSECHRARARTRLRARMSLKKKYFVIGTFSTAPYAITDFFLFSKFFGERKYSSVNGRICRIWMLPCARSPRTLTTEFFSFSGSRDGGMSDLVSLTSSGWRSDRGIGITPNRVLARHDELQARMTRWTTHTSEAKNTNFDLLSSSYFRSTFTILCALFITLRDFLLILRALFLIHLDDLLRFMVLLLDLLFVPQVAHQHKTEELPNGGALNWAAGCAMLATNPKHHRYVPN